MQLAADGIAGYSQPKYCRVLLTRQMRSRKYSGCAIMHVVHFFTIWALPNGVYSTGIGYAHM